MRYSKATVQAGIGDYKKAFDVPPAEAVQCLNPAFDCGRTDRDDAAELPSEHPSVQARHTTANCRMIGWVPGVR